MTDAGVNTTVTTFEWNGDQRVVVHAGGGVFAGATRGDGIWMFSLTGTMKSLPATTAAPGGGVAAPAGPAGRRRRPRIGRSTSSTAGSSTPRRASRVTAKAATAATAAARRSSRGLPLETILAVSQGGRNTMPAFGRAYSEADLKDVASYIVDVLAK